MFLWIQRLLTEDSKGFTILEMIVVVALLSLIVVATAPYFRTTVLSWETQDRNLEILQNGRVGIDEMTRAIKAAQSFVTIDSNDIKFKDNDNKDVRFSLVGNILKKGSTSLVEPVDSLTFSYYDSMGEEMTDETQVRLVKISMVVADSEGKVNPITFFSGVVLRKDKILYTLVINEINYNPPQTGLKEKENEWVEIYNYGTDNLDVAGWKIDNDSILAGNGTTVIPGGGYAIITAEPTEVYDNYTVDPDAIRLKVGDNKIGNGLANNSDTITIKDSDGNIVDSVSYDDSWGGDGDGDTIERKVAAGPSSEAANWEASSTTGSYTAGAENSVAP